MLQNVAQIGYRLVLSQAPRSWPTTAA